MSKYHDIILNNKNQTLFFSNLGFGEQGAILSGLHSALFVCPDIEKARQMHQQLNALGKHNVVIDDFDKPYTISKFQSNDHKFDLINALMSLYTQNTIIITIPQILFSCVPSKEVFTNNTININIDKEYDIADIEADLIRCGYKKTDVLTCKGEFARRGDVLDVFAINHAYPIRIDFFDTTIEKMYIFDNISFEKYNDIKDVQIAPNKLNYLTDDNKDKIITQLKDLMIDNNIFTDLITDIQHDQDVPNEFLIPFVNDIVPIFNLDVPIIISNPLQFETIYNKYHASIVEKIKYIFKEKNIIKLFENCKNIIKIKDLFENLQQKLIFFENFNVNSLDIKTKYNFNSTLDYDCKSANLPSFLLNLDKISILDKYAQKSIYLCLDNLDTLNLIKKVFVEKAIPFSTNKNSRGIILTDLKIPYNICFLEEDKFYIGSTNFAHKKDVVATTTKTIKYLPKAGEYVVHNVHGIGKCEGVVLVNVAGVDKEYFKLTYRAGDSLYVPYENADSLSLYLSEGDNVTLNKLGGKEFATQKLKATKAIEDMSKELLELYAKRKATHGYKYPEDDYLYTEFENAFPYAETADQLHAIADVKNDMQQGKVMDRLICGDVGFGKTEVAMRALFKAVEAGKQVAILAPTTILSLQHCMSVKERTKEFGITVDMLNRFRSNKEQKQIISDLATGKLNVICGTHRLLSNDVSFKDLGLLILDEEQRFGVKAKEQIKQLKNNVDVLTLSATPIPRTLSMSLMQIRDISIINTPPVNRLPVKTYVIGYNEDIVVSAIREELKRNGQTLIVYNNIEKIYGFASRLKTLVDDPNAKFDVAHGQMSEVALENAIKRLYDQETNVFVSTTLIENGVDLPKANTLIVIDSDRMGLSQMYQLRGRVGRNKDQAYAYFTFNKDKALSIDASSRLQAIAENTELGSGFKIAMRDLQIRGAGELLGKVQHGHIIKIGYDMYMKLLNDTLSRLKGEKVESERDIKIDVAINYVIPHTFVDDESERLKIIAKISNILDKNSVRATLNELLAEYGRLPKEIYQLANIALLRALSKKHCVKHIIINKNNMNIVFYDDIDIKKLIKHVSNFNKYKFQNVNNVTISLDPAEFTVQSALNYTLEFLHTM